MEKYAIDEPTLTGRIEVWEPPRRFGWTWGGDLLIFELAAVDDGTELVFTTWPEDPDLAGIVSTAGGYHLCLAELTLLLDTGSAPPMTEVDEVAFRLDGGVPAAVRLSRRTAVGSEHRDLSYAVPVTQMTPLVRYRRRVSRALFPSVISTLRPDRRRRRAHPEAGATPDLYCHLPKGSRP